MPRLNDPTMEEFKNIGTYSSSAVKIDELGSSEYTLVNIVCDASGSVMNFESGLENALKEIIRACQLSPRADSLMVRLIKFNSQFEEVHGFKLLEKINLDDYNNCLHAGGGTLLYDSCINAIDATTKYAQGLFSSDFKCNAITVVLTDGDDNMSKFGQDSVKESLTKAVSSEALESLMSILVGVNVQNPTISTYLKNFKDTAGFTQYVELDNADSKTLAKLASFVSKSISATSQALGTGGASKSLTF
jgi:uncharacterized protein YegL